MSGENSMIPQAIKDVSALFAANAQQTLQYGRHDPHSDLTARLVRERMFQMLREGSNASPTARPGAR